MIQLCVFIFHFGHILVFPNTTIFRKGCISSKPSGSFHTHTTKAAAAAATAAAAASSKQQAASSKQQAASSKQQAASSSSSSSSSSINSEMNKSSGSRAQNIAARQRFRALIGLGACSNLSCISKAYVPCSNFNIHVV